jgi:hypothetical protein
MDFIAVIGNFRESYNLTACISGNPLKERPLVYTIGKGNGTAAAFVAFCEMMVLSGWLCHDKIVVLDNAAIHTGVVTLTIWSIFFGRRSWEVDRFTFW